MFTLLDTNVLVSAVLSPEDASWEVIRRCLLGEYDPLMSQALFLEHEAVLSRSDIVGHSRITEEERRFLWAAFASRCRWVRVYYLWRPNLPDEADNHLIELAVAEIIVTHNQRDFSRTELRFPGLRVLTPSHLIAEE